MLALLPAVLPGYLIFQVSIALTYAIAILGLNPGHGFQRTDLAGAGRVLRSRRLHRGDPYGDSLRPFVLGRLPPAVIAAIVLGFIIGVPALRLQGLQLAIVTLMLAAVVPPLILRLDKWTKGTRASRSSSNRPAVASADAGRLHLFHLPRGGRDHRPDHAATRTWRDRAAAQERA